MKNLKFLFLILLPGLMLTACGGDSNNDPASTSDSSGGQYNPPAELDGSHLTCVDSQAGRKQAYYGDLHVHTSYSLDAYNFNAINGPREAYRFAKGDETGLPAGNEDPYTVGRKVQLDRPLDFTAVTDHAEFMGGLVYACEGGPLGLDGSLNPACDVLGDQIRGNIRAIIEGSAPLHIQVIREVTGLTPTGLLAWQDMMNIADEEYEPCDFTTLKGYEYTAFRGKQMLHRNVFFLGDDLPNNAFSSMTPDFLISDNNLNDDWRLFDHLQQSCQGDGCQVFTIPHNPNLSAGRMFLPREEATGLPIGRNGDPMTVADARLRAYYDKAVELTQHKGASECGPGLTTGTLEGEETGCGFEMVKNVCLGKPSDPPACAQYCKGLETDPSFCGFTEETYAGGKCETVGPNVTSGPGNCAAPLDMARTAITEGLVIKQNLDGVNPYKLNFVAATDTHNGTPGNVQEKGFPGHGGVLDNDPREQLGAWFCDSASEDPADPDNCSNRVFLEYFRPYNPGGITGVWAEENTREQIWHGVHRGETFGTSGPRMKIRTLATWTQPPADICDRLAAGENPIDTGELTGARMGADMPERNGNDGPWIVAWAMQDPGGEEPGNPLQRLDIIKGTVGNDGEPLVSVFEGVAKTSETVELPSRQTCAVNPGHHPEQLCVVWQDKHFQAGTDAYYYARALEVPSCRFNTHLCVANQTDCSLLDPANGMFPEETGMQGYEGCCTITGEPGSFAGSNTFHTIEERAWASPIWYTPDQAQN